MKGVRDMTRAVVRDNQGTVHRFTFSDSHVGFCSCHRWAVTKIPMTPRRAEQLAKKYGKPVPLGGPFVELTKEQALRDWGYHVANLPGQEIQRSTSGTVRQEQEELVTA